MIKELTSDAEIRAAYGLVRELRPQLSEDDFVELVAAMRPGGYRLFALRRDGSNGNLALAGVRIGVNLSYGRHVWVHDLVTTASERSRGHGAALLAHLEQLAHDEECECIALCSENEETDAHRFCEDRMSYERVSTVWKKTIATAPASTGEAADRTSFGAGLF